MSEVVRDIEKYVIFHLLARLILHYRKYSKPTQTEFDIKLNVFLGARTTLVQFLILIISLFFGHLFFYFNLLITRILINKG